MVNLTGDLGLPLLITGIALYLTRKHRVVQAITLALCYFGWYFVLIYLQVRGLPGFSFVQMFTTYYEWIGGVLAAVSYTHLFFGGSSRTARIAPTPEMAACGIWFLEHSGDLRRDIKSRVGTHFSGKSHAGDDGCVLSHRSAV